MVKVERIVYLYTVVTISPNKSGIISHHNDLNKMLYRKQEGFTCKMVDSD
jgi:hypothetical protein